MPKFLSDGIFDGSSTDLIVDGKIGIGITPSAKLTVSNPSDYEIVLETGTASHGKLAIGHFSNGSMITTFGNDGGAGDLIRFGTHTGDERMRITSGGNIGINETNPTQKLHVDGGIRITGAYYDSNNSPGTSGQVLSSTATGTDWIDQGDIVASEADKAKSVILRVKNSTASAMSKGQVICEAVSATPPNGNLIEVALADNNGTNTMPALGILNEDLDAAGGANDEGDAIMFGKVSGINTSAFSVGDEVFVDDTPGGLTATKPTGVKYIQKVGVVIRDDASNGTIEVFGAGRVNDVPTPLYIDHANQRLGIVETSPDAKLHIDAPTGDFLKITESGADRLTLDSNGEMVLTPPSNWGSYFKVGKNVGPYEVAIELGEGRTANNNARIDFIGDTTYTDYGFRIIRGNGGANTTSQLVHRGTGNFELVSTDSGDIILNPNDGNVGIGTTSPSQKLEVEGNSWIKGIYYDTSGDAGASGQVLSSTATGTNWITLNDIYYTETEADSRFVNVTGDTMTGDLIIQKTNPLLKLVDNNTSTGNYPAIEFETSNSQGVRLEHNEFDNELPIAGYGLVLKESDGNSQFPSTGTLSLSVLGEIYAGATTLGSLNKVFHDGYHPNADKWTTARTITLGGDLTGSVSLDGSANVTLSAQVVNNSHTHDDRYVELTGDTMTGNLFIGSGSSDNYVTSYYSDGAYTQMRGFGLYMSRTSSYIRPVSDNTQTLYIGTNSNQWNTLSIDASTTTFDTNGSENMRITSSGSVGIGTTNPSEKLAVSGGNIEIADGNIAGRKIGFDVSDSISFNSTTIAQYGMSNAGNSEAGGITYSGFFGQKFFTNGSQRMVIERYGDVGINETDPSQRLHVNGNARVTGAYYDSNNSPGTSNQILSSTASGTDWISIENLGTFLDIIDVSESGNTTAEWSLIKTLPASTSSQRDTLFIKIVGGGWNDNMRFEAEITLSNRDSFNYFWDVKGGSEYFTGGNGSNRLRVVAYSQTDGTVDVYLYKTSYMTGWIYATFQNTGAPEIITSLGSPTTTQPSGTEVFTTYGNAYPANIAAVDDKVGIGTTSPQSKLQVSASGNETTLMVGASGTLSDKSSRIFLNEGENGVTDSKDYGFSLAYDGNSSAQYGLSSNQFGIIRHDNSATGSAVMRINRSSNDAFFSGNVGVGMTTSPAEKLHVYNGSAYITPIAYAANQNDWVIRAGAYNNTSFDQGLKLKSSSGGVSYMAFETAHSGGETMVLRSGKVGIGTDNPGAKLTVVDDILLTGSSPSLTLTDATSSFVIKTNTAGEGIVQTSGTSKPIRFFRNNGANESMRIDGAGNVGIGITNLEASAALTLHRNDVDLEFSVDYAVADTARILSYDRTANTHRDLQLRGKKLTFYTNSSEKMRLEEDGDLHVDGDVIAYSTTISDSRLKNEVKTINSAVDKVKKLRGVEYVWNKGSKEGQKDLGVIAQEVEKVLPEIVKEKKIPLITENNDKLFKTVDYEKITAVLIEAIKEQQKQIDELKNQLDAFTK